MTPSCRLFSHLLPLRLRTAALALLPGLLAACATPQAGPQTSPPTAQVQAPAAAVAASAPSSTEPAAPSAEKRAQAASLLEDSLEPDEHINLDAPELHADLWSRLRAGFTLPDLDDEWVSKAEAWYSARPDYVQRMSTRGSLYLYHIVQEVEKRGMPAELALLPFIESAFVTHAVSSAKASGMWQFMPATGRDFDLKQNIFRDDRRDVLASTRAALDYLQRLHKMFDDWHLALAAYNWGPGNVQRAIKRNQRLGLPTDYASLKMPEETRYYVPKLQAVKNIVMAPERYALSLPPVDNHPYFLSVKIERDIDVALAAELAGVSLETFRQFNPQHNKPVILAAATEQVLLPYDQASQFATRLAEHEGPLASWTAWVLPQTMSAQAAAQKVHMDEKELQRINKIPARMLIKKGSTLIVPRARHVQNDVSETLADNAALLLTPDAPARQRIQLKARKGDTLARVAARNGVSAKQLAQWNDLSSQAKLKAGQTLVAYAAPKAKRSTQRTVLAQAHTPAAKKSSTKTSGPRKAARSTRVASTAKAKAKRTRVSANSSRHAVLASAP